MITIILLSIAYLLTGVLLLRTMVDVWPPNDNDLITVERMGFWIILLWPFALIIVLVYAVSHPTGNAKRFLFWLAGIK